VGEFLLVGLRRPKEDSVSVGEKLVGKSLIYVWLQYSCELNNFPLSFISKLNEIE